MRTPPKPPGETQGDCLALGHRSQTATRVTCHFKSGTRPPSAAASDRSVAPRGRLRRVAEDRRTVSVLLLGRSGCKSNESRTLRIAKTLGGVRPANHSHLQRATLGSTDQQIPPTWAGVHREIPVASLPFAAVPNRKCRVIGIRDSIADRLMRCDQATKDAPMTGSRPRGMTACCASTASTKAAASSEEVGV